MDFSHLDRYLDSLLAAGLPMYDCTVWQNHEEIYRRAGGYIDVAEKRRHEPGTKYFFYSCTKPVTTAAAMTLIEAGRCRLNDPLSAYLPEFAEMTVAERAEDGTVTTRPAQTAILVRDLFTMTAGFNYNLNAPSVKAAVAAAHGRPTTRDVARAIAKEPLSFDPGDRWQYSLCHDVLAAFAEEVAGRRFADFVRETVFAPLGMEDTSYHLTEASAARLAKLYRFEAERRQAVPIPCVNNYVLGDRYDSGGAGLVSTVEDYILFADAMANGGEGKNGARILAPETVELWRTPALTPHAARTFNWPQFAGSSYAFGIQRLTDRAAAGATAPLGVCGWNGAAGSIAMISPETGVSVVCAQHALTPPEDTMFPAFRNVVFSCLGR